MREGERREVVVERRLAVGLWKKRRRLKRKAHLVSTVDSENE